MTTKEASRQHHEGKQKGESSVLVKKLQRWQRKHKVRGEELHRKSRYEWNKLTASTRGEPARIREETQETVHLRIGFNLHPSPTG